MTTSFAALLILIILLLYIQLKYVYNLPCGTYSIGGEFGVDLEMVTDVVGVGAGDASVDNVVYGTADDVVLGCAAVDNVVDGTADDVVSSCAGDPVDVEPSTADSVDGDGVVDDDVAASVVGTGAVALAELKLATKVVLGEGAFGAVYLVEHKRRHEQRYALKLLNEDESTLCFARAKKDPGHV